MATLPLPSISMLSPFFGAPANSAGLDPLSPTSLARLLDSREQSIPAMAPQSQLSLKPMECPKSEALPSLPSLGFQTQEVCKPPQLPKGPLSVSSPSLEPLAQVAICNINDEMDSASNAVLSNPVTPPPGESASVSRALSIEALLTPRGEDGTRVMPLDASSRSESFRLPEMHSPSSSAQNSPLVSALSHASAHRKPEAVPPLAQRPVERPRGRGPGRGEFGPQMNQSRYWTEAEHQRFLQAVRTFGAHNHKAIASFVATRSSAQVRSHSQKFFKKLETFRGQGLPSMTRKRKTLKDISMHQ